MTDGNDGDVPSGNDRTADTARLDWLAENWWPDREFVDSDGTLLDPILLALQDPNPAALRAAIDESRRSQ